MPKWRTNGKPRITHMWTTRRQWVEIDGSSQDCSNSNASTFEFLQFCTKSSISYCKQDYFRRVKWTIDFQIITVLTLLILNLSFTIYQEFLLSCVNTRWLLLFCFCCMMCVHLGAIYNTLSVCSVYTALIWSSQRQKRTQVNPSAGTLIEILGYHWIFLATVSRSCEILRQYECKRTGKYVEVFLYRLDMLYGFAISTKCIGCEQITAER